MNIPESLSKILSEHFTPEELDAVTTAMKNAVELQVESRIHQYEEEACKRIDDLVALINESHSAKFKQVTDKVKEKFTALKEQAEARYNKGVISEAASFKAQLARDIESFINSKIDSVVNFNIIKESAKNRAASNLLSALRKTLAIDTALMNESLARPIADAKQRLKGASEYIKQLKEKNQQLNESLEATKGDLLLEQKINTLPAKAAEHMRLMFKNKPVQYINENYDYVLGLYNDNQAAKRNVLAKEAMKSHASNKSRVREAKHTRDLMGRSTMAADDKLISECLDAMKPLV